MNRLGLATVRAGALIAAAAVIGAAIAANPAGAAGVHAMLQKFVTTCTSSSACSAYQNLGSGPAIQGIGTSGIGLLGQSTTNNGVSGGSSHANGVRGVTTSPSSTGVPPASGVIGEDNSTDGGAYNFGVVGNSKNGTGVHGTTKAPSGHSGYPPQSGVLGEDLSTDGDPFNSGVQGVSTQGTGVLGVSSHKFGVKGTSADGPAGVDGESGGSAAGVSGASATGVGVYAISTSNFGVFSQSNQTNAIYARSGGGDKLATILAFGGTTTKGGQSLATFDSLGSATFWVDNAGNAHVRGLIITGGSCSAGCIAGKNSQPTQVQRYTPQEAMPTIEDVGEAQLSDGSAYVRVDPSFANVMDSRTSYLVFITPQGLTRGLYVTNKTPRGFQVLELPGGHASIAFDYRIVARPIGDNSPRLPFLTNADMPTVGHPQSLPR